MEWQVYGKSGGIPGFSLLICKVAKGEGLTLGYFFEDLTKALRVHYRVRDESHYFICSFRELELPCWIIFNRALVRFSRKILEPIQLELSQFVTASQLGQ